MVSQSLTEYIYIYIVELYSSIYNTQYIYIYIRTIYIYIVLQLGHLTYNEVMALVDEGRASDVIYLNQKSGGQQGEGCDHPSLLCPHEACLEYRVQA